MCLFAFFLVQITSVFAQAGRGITYTETYGFVAIPAASITAAFTGADETITTAISTGAFTVTFGGRTYSSFYISSNGFVILSNNAAGSPAPIGPTPANNLAAIPAGSGPIIAPLWDDLISTALYRVAGSVTTGFVSVDWTNVYWDKNAASPHLARMQLKMYSSGHSTNAGRIEFYYQPIVATVPQAYGPYSNTSGGASIGIADTCGGDYYSVTQGAVITNTQAWANGTASKTVHTSNINNLGATNTVLSQVQSVVFNKSTPYNDQCASYIDLGNIPGGTCTPTIATLIGATNIGTPVGACDPANANDVWFRITKPAYTSYFRVNTDFSTVCKAVTTSVEVYTGTCSALTSVACATSGGTINANNAIVNINNSSNACNATSYYIRVAGDASAEGEFALCVENNNPSSCVNATLIPAILPQSFSCKTTCGSGNNYNSTMACSSSYINGEDYVYVYTPTTTANSCVSISISNTGSSSNPGLFVFDNCPDAIGVNCIASGTSSGPSVTLLPLSLTIGVTYYIVVSSTSSPYCIPFNLFVSEANCSAPTNTWTQKTNFSFSGRTNSVAFNIGNKGYVGTGFDSGSHFLKDLWEYDPQTDSWAQKADLPGDARHSAVGFGIGNKGYIGTGVVGTSISVPYKSDFWEYDPSTNTWTQKANYGGGNRAFAVGFSIGNKGYIGTGAISANIYRATFWEYDPVTDMWTQKADHGGGAISNGVAFVIGTKGYVSTGTLSSVAQQQLWAYDPATNLWTQKANLPGIGRYDGLGFAVGSRGYVGTGYDGTQFHKKDFWEYNPGTNSWLQVADFGGSPRYQSFAFAFGSKAYVGAGRDPGGLPVDFWEYSPNPSCNVQPATSTNSVTCFGANDGSVTVTLSGTGTTTIGTIVLDGGASVAYASNPFTVSGLSVGAHSLVVTTGFPCTMDPINFSITGPTSPSTSSQTVSACDSYTWSVSGSTYSSSGVYVFNGVNGSGCPHQAILNLTINSSTTFSQTETACNSYLWPVNGNTYTSSGSYTYIGTNANGCTQTSTLNLIVNPTSISTVTQVVCDSYTWPQSGQTYNSSGSYPDTIASLAGCDSIIILGLTVNNSNSTEVISACDNYTWLKDGNTYTSTGTYTHTELNALGCLHVSTLVLTINHSTSSNESIDACNSYYWATDGNTYTYTGTFVHIGSNAEGCTHTSTLNLIIRDTTYFTQNIISCDFYKWGINDSTYFTSGVYTHIGTNAFGCPHISILYLTISHLNVSAVAQSPILCFGTTVSVDVSANDGISPYSGTGVFQQGAGTQIYSVTDDNGCQGSTVLSLLEPQKIGGNIIASPIICGLTNGTAAILPLGGTSPYTYHWSNGQTDSIASGLAAGAYSVIITDVNNCTGIVNTIIPGVGLPPDAAGAISGQLGACRNTCGIVYSVTPVSGATSYHWTLPPGATGTSTTNNITLCFDSTYIGGFLCVSPENSCGAGMFSCINIPVITVRPAQPGFIVGNPNPCGPNVYTYSIPLSTNASYYTWYVTGAGVYILSGQGTNTVQVSFPEGFGQSVIAVFASNCIGLTSTRSTTLTGIPAHSSALTGPGNVCAGTNGVGYSVSPVIGAGTSYLWSGTANMTVASSNLNTCTINFGPAFSTGVLSITTSSACGSFTKNYTIGSAPTQPGSITGPSKNLCGLSGVTYSISPISTAISYNWTVPAGVNIISNSGLSIIVDFTTAFTGTGNICVSSVNNCGTSIARCYSVTALTAAPSSPFGPTAVCKSSSSVLYTIPAVVGASNYLWSITANAGISSGGNTANVNYTTALSPAAVITVNAVNSCGISSPGKISVTINLSCRTASEFSEPGNENSSWIYPNPSTGFVTLKFYSQISEAYSLQVIDVLGQILLSSQIESSIGLNFQEIDMTSLTKGVYFVGLKMEGKVEDVLRVVKQ